MGEGNKCTICCDSFKTKNGLLCEVERVVWDHFSPHRLLASTDKGQVVCVDLRLVT